MNFLSHHYLQAVDNDIYYSIGVTLPDIISLADSKAIISQKILDSMPLFSSDSNYQSLYQGLSSHLLSDRKFHQSSFFKENTHRLQLLAEEHSTSIHPALFHILLEIFLDRYLIQTNNDLLDSFYSLYSDFPHHYLQPLIEDLPHGNWDSFHSFLIFFIESRFCDAYQTEKGVTETLVRVSKRLLNKRLDRTSVGPFITNAYNDLYAELKKFFMLTTLLKK